MWRGCFAASGDFNPHFFQLPFAFYLRDVVITDSGGLWLATDAFRRNIPGRSCAISLRADFCRGLRRSDGPTGFLIARRLERETGRFWREF
jgi:hypothetical protein